MHIFSLIWFLDKLNHMMKMNKTIRLNLLKKGLIYTIAINLYSKWYLELNVNR